MDIRPVEADPMHSDRRTEGALRENANAAQKGATW